MTAYSLLDGRKRTEAVLGSALATILIASTMLPLPCALVWFGGSLLGVPQTFSLGLKLAIAAAGAIASVRFFGRALRQECDRLASEPSRGHGTPEG